MIIWGLGVLFPLEVSLGQNLCGVFNEIFCSLLMSSLMVSLVFPSCFIFYVREFLRVFLASRAHAIFLTENISQKHLLNLRKIQTVISVFNFFLNVEN